MTAIEWLFEEMQKTYIFNQNDFDMFKKAKEMEKQQIIDAYRRSTYQFEVDAKINCRTAEEYYNETFINK